MARAGARDGHVPKGEVVPKTLPEPKILWRIGISNGLASPIVFGDRVYYMDNHEGMEALHAIDKSNAKEFWRVDIDRTFTDAQNPPGPRCTPLVDGDRIYAQSCKGELRCLKVADGSPIWQVNYVKDFSAVFTGEKGMSVGAARHGNNAAPVIDGDRLFAAVGGSNGESVVCFDKMTGKVLWKSQDDPAGYGAPCISGSSPIGFNPRPDSRGAGEGFGSANIGGNAWFSGSASGET